MKLPAAMRIKYDQFMKEGSLIVLEGTVLDMMEVYEDWITTLLNAVMMYDALVTTHTMQRNLLNVGQVKWTIRNRKSYPGCKDRIRPTWRIEETFRRANASV